MSERGTIQCTECKQWFHYEEDDVFEEDDTSAGGAVLTIFTLGTVNPKIRKVTCPHCGTDNEV